MKKIISWNVASIRARMTNLQTLLIQEKPDIVFLQEIKVQTDNFPYEDLKNLGYNAYVSGQKAWNGVAILSKDALTLKSTSLPGFEDQARFIETIDTKGESFISVYVPNGQAPIANPQDTSRLEYKLNWLKALKKRLLETPRFIIGGDFNVIQKDNDVYNPETFRDSVLMLPCVREAFEDLLSLDLLNPIRSLYPEGGLYTFWDFQGGAWAKNHGIGLDYIFLSKNHKNDSIQGKILIDYRKIEKPSDHAPVAILID